jgi:hypothetical protein
LGRDDDAGGCEESDEEIECEVPPPGDVGAELVVTDIGGGRDEMTEEAVDDDDVVSGFKGWWWPYEAGNEIDEDGIGLAPRIAAAFEELRPEGWLKGELGLEEPKFVVGCIGWAKIWIDEKPSTSRRVTPSSRVTHLTRRRAFVRSSPRILRNLRLTVRHSRTPHQTLKIRLLAQFRLARKVMTVRCLATRTTTTRGLFESLDFCQTARMFFLDTRAESANRVHEFVEMFCF